MLQFGSRLARGVFHDCSSDESSYADGSLHNKDYHDEINAVGSRDITAGADGTQRNFTDDANGCGIFADDDFAANSSVAYPEVCSLP